MSDRYEHFPALSTEEWEANIRRETGEKDAIKNLSFTSPEEITVRPFYHYDTFKSVSPAYNPPDWQIAETINMAQLREGDAISDTGIERIVLQSGGIENEDWELLFRSGMPVHLQFPATGMDAPISIPENGPGGIHFHLHMDPVGQLAKTGNWYTDEKADWNMVEEAIRNPFPKSSLSVDAGIYQNSGASRVSQLALALAHANEYLSFISENGLNKERAYLVFKIAIGSDYFFEIAKIQALRWLYSSLTMEYGMPGACFILAEPTIRNKTFLDYNVNMLRTTTECMAAALGGADAILNHGYDRVYQGRNDFATRIARNQLLILKYEAGIKGGTNSISGTYYLDYLTKELAQQALRRFKEIEADGGLISGLKSGKIQSAVTRSAREEESKFRNGDLTLVGTKAKNDEWELPPNIDEASLNTPGTSKEQEVAPLIPRRLASEIENTVRKNG